MCLRCVCGVPAECLQCVCNVCGVFAVRLRCVCCVFAVCLRCVCGAFAVYLRCVCGAFAVCLRCVFVMPETPMNSLRDTQEPPREAPKRHPGGIRTTEHRSGISRAPSGHQWTKMSQKCDTVVKNRAGPFPPAESGSTLSAPPGTTKNPTRTLKLKLLGKNKV